MTKMTKKKEINFEVEFDISSLSVDDIVAWLEYTYKNNQSEVADSNSISEKNRMKTVLKTNLDFFIKKGYKLQAINTYYALTGAPFDECEKYVYTQLMIDSVDVLEDLKKSVNEDYIKSYTKSKTTTGVFDLSNKV